MFKKSMTVIRWLFGTWYLLNGINFFFALVQVPRPTNAMAGILMQGFVGSGMFSYVKVIEIVAGASALTNRYVPLSLVVSFPVTVMIGYIDVIILGRENYSWFWGGWLFVAHAILLLAYMPYYRSMLVSRAAVSNPMAPSAPVAHQVGVSAE